MSSVKNLYYQGCSYIPMPLLKLLAPSATLLPYHHTVSSRFLPHIGHLYNYKNERQFIADLDYLLKHYRAVSLEEVITSFQTRKRTPRNAFLLSFDDGFKEISTTIAPILKQKGVPAVFFLSPAFIDNRQLFYRCKISLLIGELQKTFASKGLLKVFAEALNCEQATEETIIACLKKVNQNNAAILDELAAKCEFSFDTFLQKEQPFVTTAQVQELHAQGFSVGAHSIDHPYYQLLSLTEQEQQTLTSCRQINALLQNESCSFSFPHSDKEISQAFFNHLEPENIPLYFGIQNQKRENHNRVLHRFNAERPETPMNFQLKGLIFLMTMRRLLGKDKVTRL